MGKRRFPELGQADVCGAPGGLDGLSSPKKASKGNALHMEPLAKSQSSQSLNLQLHSFFTQKQYLLNKRWSMWAPLIFKNEYAYLCSSFLRLLMEKNYR